MPFSFSKTCLFSFSLSFLLNISLNNKNIFACFAESYCSNHRTQNLLFFFSLGAKCTHSVIQLLHKRDLIKVFFSQKAEYFTFFFLKGEFCISFFYFPPTLWLAKLSTGYIDEYIPISESDKIEFNKNFNLKRVVKNFFIFLF